MGTDLINEGSFKGGDWRYGFVHPMPSNETSQIFST